MAALDLACAAEPEYADVLALAVASYASAAAGGSFLV
jgi:hypothetical protein